MMKLDRVLADQSLLSGLSESQLEALDRSCSVVNYKSGQFLFERSREANRFFLITKGKVSLELYTQARGPKPLQILGPGDLVGTSWLTPPYRWKLDARAMDDTEALVFNARDVLALCEADHELGYQLWKRFFTAVSQRLDAAQAQMLAFYTNKP